ncbi:MAG: hypothetical protein PHQ57_04505, partial [Candidatus Omnitrophica bacterium]|nr:hypothetical protein [Candidatus Omnitrophota bacterium]
MAKKEFPKLEGDFSPKGIDFGPADLGGGGGGGLRGKMSAFSGKAFGIIKFILGICFLPFVYSISISFLSEFDLIEKSLGSHFWSGVVSFLIIYLFILEPVKLYAKGQKLLELIFNFFKPLVKVAPYLLPVYTIILFALYWPLSLLFPGPGTTKTFVFLFGFSMALHLVFSAKTMRAKKGDFLKGNYIFGFSFIYILNLA